MHQSFAPFIRTKEESSFELSCNFDENDSCGGTIFSNNTGLLNQFEIALSAVAISYTITDVTSISIKAIILHPKYKELIIFN
jgi:hypothetical protein